MQLQVWFSYGDWNAELLPQALQCKEKWAGWHFSDASCSIPFPAWDCLPYSQQKQPFTPFCKEEWVKGHQLTEISATIDLHGLLQSIHFSANVANEKTRSIKIACGLWYVKSSLLPISSTWSIPLILDFTAVFLIHIPELLEAACRPVKLE